MSSNSQPIIPTCEEKPVNLLGLDRAGMDHFFLDMAEKRFRSDQILKWIYHEGVTDFEQMTNLSKALRERLIRCAEIRLPEIISDHPSSDGTRKWVLRLDSDNAIEMVFIPEEGRGTLCVSSQVGCTLACSFCSTARQGFNRNLATEEITGQVLLAAKLLETPENMGERVVTNVVLMGMGEPLLNFDAVVRAMNIMQEDLGFGISKRRVTLSTAGVVPAIYRLKEVSDVSLAVSLHASNDALRDQLVPLNKKYPLKELLKACAAYAEDKRGKKRITFEYVMLAGINDSIEDAHALVRLLRPLPSKVNLIPFNPFPGSTYHCSSLNQINRFREVIMQSGIIAVTRKTRGDDIAAACGQLVGDVNDRTRRSERLQQEEVL